MRLNRLEARVGIEPTHKGFADPFLARLTLPDSTATSATPFFCPLFVRLAGKPSAKSATQAQQAIQRSFFRQTARQRYWVTHCILSRLVLWPRFLTKQDFKRIVRPSRPVGAAEMCLISTTCISATRSAQSERHHDSDRERGAGVRIGTTNKCNVRTDYVELRKRVREPAASMPVVVPQETVVLI